MMMMMMMLMMMLIMIDEKLRNCWDRRLFHFFYHWGFMRKKRRKGMSQTEGMNVGLVIWWILHIFLVGTEPRSQLVISRQANNCIKHVGSSKQLFQQIKQFHSISLKRLEIIWLLKGWMMIVDPLSCRFLASWLSLFSISHVVIIFAGNPPNQYKTFDIMYNTMHIPPTKPFIYTPSNQHVPWKGTIFKGKLVVFQASFLGG